MIDELERIWTSSFVAQSRLYIILCPDRLTETIKKKPSVGIVGDLPQIRNTNLPHTSLERYRYINPFDVNA